MRLAATLLLVFAMATAQGHALPCRERWVYLLVGDGVLPGTLYHVDYHAPDDDCLCADDWLYAETGALAGVQTGASHAVFGSTWGHDHRCQWPVEAERDLLLY